ncbi:MAG: hypothetical protein JWL84_1479 [Rhodospirillales bacterium]|nr:hypothetical protein [Rhodospirillales bacterium]
MIRGLLCIALGLLAGLAAVALTQLEWRHAAALLAALAAAVGLLCFGSGKHTSYALVAILAAGIPVHVSATFLPYPQARDQYVPHMVTSAGIALSVPLLAAVGLAVVQFLTAPPFRILSGIRLEPIASTGFGLFFAAGTLSLVNSADWQLSAFELIRIASLFLLSLLISNLDRGAIRVYVGSLVTAVFLQGALAVAQYVSSSTFGIEALWNSEPTMDEFSALFRGVGTAAGPNGLAYFLEIFLPMILALLLVERRPAQFMFYFAALVFGLAGDLATLSRASWIALPLPFAVIIVAFGRKRIRSIKAAAIGVVVMIAALITVVAAGPIVVQRFTGDDGGSAATRPTLNRAAWTMIEQFPIFGVGINNFADSFTRYDRDGGSRIFHGGNAIVHNVYLLVWGETGIIGLFAFLWYFGSAFCLGYLVLTRSEDVADRAIVLGAVVGIVAGMTHAVVDISGITPETAAQIGLLAALRQLTARPVPEPRRDRQGMAQSQVRLA